MNAKYGIAKYDLVVTMWKLGSALVLFAMVASVASTGPLKIGDLFPDINGETLAGSSLSLPAAAVGKVTLVIFSFTKKGGSFAKQWGERFSREFGSNTKVASYSVLVLENVPRLLRGLVSSGIKKGMPKDLHAKAIQLFKDENVWKERLNVLNKDHAYLVLLDSAGNILFLHSGIMNDKDFDTLKKSFP